MREKLQTLPLAELKEMARNQGIKGISSLRKAEIIDLLCEAAEKNPEVKPTEIRKEERRQAPDNAQPRQETVKPRQDNAQTRQDNIQSRQDNAQSRQDNAQSRQDNIQPRQDNTQSRQDTIQSRPQESQDRQESRNQEPRRNTNRSYENNKYSANKSQQNRPHTNYSQNQGANQQSEGGERASRNDSRTDSRAEGRSDTTGLSNQDMAELDSGIEANGILEVMPDGFGFIRCENFLPGENDVYVAPSQIRRFNLKTGDIIAGNRRVKSATEKFAALLYIKTVNGYPLSATETRPNFEDLTPIFPNQRLHMEMPGVKTSVAMRVLDLLSPIGKGQRGMIVSPPKAGKTTLLKQVAKAITTNHPDMHLMILLIDERPEEVTDIREAIVGPNVEVIYSTFDELPERHKRVSEMVAERAKRLVEHGRDVIILLDSITRLARAYNLTVAPSGRTLSGGLDPAALHMPKRFFGAARNMREGGSLTVLATALVDTGSRMDDVVYEEFKGTGNMELVLDRKLSEKRIFPAIDILKSGTRRDDLLLTREEAEAVDIIHKATNSMKPEDAVEKILDLFARTRNNREFVENAKRIRFY
ncbi:transcription termination factor Rho [Lachnoclostridium pacaense]|uniref:transcription termination factor Rho n=1 Tax=Enterocloster hominis (ex Hitch et al. 2024) TaxID=1917870 RepID=UPI001D104F9C|nr:transcription termination factor Rho [Lachnoclostridium pacaense]MCC2879733.1 transcription termination factor Rho [Lachnoclostridium pacaense]